MIDIDLTAIIQFANFIITLVVLNLLLIRPVRELISKRRASMAAFAADTATLNERAKQALADYEEKLAATRTKGVTLTASAREDGQKEASIITVRAQTEAHDIVRAATKDALANAGLCRDAMAARMPQLLHDAYHKLVPADR